MNLFDRSFWVLGTDTGIGKTYVTSLLGLWCQAHGHSFSLTKPVASGVHDLMGDMINDDVESLKAVVSGHQAGDEICPWLLEAEMAPWSAAKKENKNLSADAIAKHVKALERKYGLVIAEGIGGISVPLNNEETFLDAVEKSGLPVVLVVGARLGCVNHCLLSLEVLEKRGIEVKALFFSHCTEGVEEAVLESSLKEISSRFGKIIELPHLASYPMALGHLEKSPHFF